MRDMAVSATPLVPVIGYCFFLDWVFTAAFLTAGSPANEPCCWKVPRDTLYPFALSSSQNNSPPLAW